MTVMTPAAPDRTTAKTPSGRSGSRAVALRALLRDKRAVVALAVLLLLIVAALFAPLIAPYDPSTQNLLLRLRPPPGRTAAAAPTSWAPTSSAATCSRASSTAPVSPCSSAPERPCSPASWARPWASPPATSAAGRDRTLMRLADVQLAFPSLLLALAVVGFLGSGLWMVILVLGFTGWVSYARVVRSEVMSLRTRDFVTEARAIGVTDVTIMRRHLLPNVMAPLATIGTLHVAAAIVAEASLSYLGLGVPKETVTWGGMLADGQLYLGTSWWVAVFPGIALMLTSLAINITGDALRDVADPKAYRR